MFPTERLSLVVAALVVGLAFVAAPHSCAGGLDAYAGAGLAALALVVAASLFLRDRPRSRWRRVMPVLVVAAAWLAGFGLAGFRLICRLF